MSEQAPPESSTAADRVHSGQSAAAARQGSGAGAAAPSAPSVSPTGAHRAGSGGPGAAPGAEAAPSAGDAQVEAAARRSVDDEDAEQAADEAEDDAETAEAASTEGEAESAGSDGVSAKGRKRGGVFNRIADFVSGTPDVVPTHDATDFTDDADLKKIKSAIAHALVIAQKAQKRINKDNSVYKTYIDAHAGDTDADKGAVQARIDKVKAGFDKIVECLTEDKVIFKKWDLAEDNKIKEPNTFAYVRKAEAENNIYLGGAFWVARTRGFDSSAGTIVHELSHRLANTVDHVYGQSGAKDKAENAPDQAAENADNWEYLAES